MDSILQQGLGESLRRRHRLARPIYPGWPFIPFHLVFLAGSRVRA